MLWGPKFGMLKKSGVFTFENLTPALVASILSKASPTLMWLGNEAADATELVAGTDHLSDTGSPAKQVLDAALGGRTTALVTTATGLDAASSSVADVGAVTITIMAILRQTTTPVAVENLVGKRDNAGSLPGYEVTSNTSGHVTWRIDTTSGVTARTVAVDHGTVNPQVYLATTSITDNVGSMFTREGASEGDDGFGETLTNPEIFTAGDGALRNAAHHNLAAIMVWIGSDGDGFSETERLLMAQELGYE